MTERLQKYLARAGVASRRHAEELITAGRVQVNNATVKELGTKVEPGEDLVTVDGTLVSVPEDKVYYILYKPAGVVTTMEDPQGRTTVAQYLGEVERRVFPVGRLDFDAEGALLMTDDGAIAHALTHPSFEVRRTYLAKVKGTPTGESLERLEQGVRLEDGMASALEASVFEQAERNTWIKIVVAEGRPHLIKRLCAAIGHPVVRLFRPAQGGISVRGLKPGELRALSKAEVERLESISQGGAMPAEELSLPPRRHGRGAPGMEEDEGFEPAPPPTRGAGRGAAGRTAAAGATRGGRAAAGRGESRGGGRFGAERGESRGGGRFGAERGESRSGGRFGAERGGSRGGGRFGAERGESRGGGRFGAERGESRGGGRFGAERGESRGGGRFGAERGESRGGGRFGAERGESRGGGRFGAERGESRGGGRFGAERGESRGGGRFGAERGGSRGGGRFGAERGESRGGGRFGAERAPRTGGSRDGGRFGTDRGERMGGARGTGRFGTPAGSRGGTRGGTGGRAGTRPGAPLGGRPGPGRNGGRGGPRR